MEHPHYIVQVYHNVSFHSNKYILVFIYIYLYVSIHTLTLLYLSIKECES